MVVVVILGVLAATIIPQFIGTTHDAKVSAAKAHVAELESALERFNVHMDRYPTAEEGLKVLVEAPGNEANKWRGPYIKQLRPDPWGNPYQYRVPRECITPRASISGPRELMATTAGRARARTSETGSTQLMSSLQTASQQVLPQRVPERGFTLIELMVVIAIIGIAAAMIVPEMKGSYEDAVLRSASRELVDAFQLAYGRAVSLNQPHRVRIDEGSGRYLIEASLGQGPGSHRSSVRSKSCLAAKAKSIRASVCASGLAAKLKKNPPGPAAAHRRTLKAANSFFLETERRTLERSGFRIVRDLALF